jgi:hypothetical protein
MKKIFKLILAYIIAIYLVFTKKTYYISGTGRFENGERMFFKTVFVTHGSMLPIKNIEDKMKSELHFMSCIVLFFSRIPNRMKKYVSEECPILVDSDIRIDLNT